MQQTIRRSFIGWISVLLGLVLVMVGCDSQSTLTESRGPSLSTNGNTTSFGVDTVQSDSSFLVAQGDSCFCVTALSTADSTVEEFYGYMGRNHGHSLTSTGIEKSNVSNLFLYEGSLGRSLVVLHDAPGDKHGNDIGGGGSASFDFSGLSPSNGEWVVMDDVPSLSDFDSNVDLSPDWAWEPIFTDGGAWRGGLDGPFWITIDPAFNEDAARYADRGRIEEWHMLSGDATNPDRINLDMDEPVSIHFGCIRVDLQIKRDHLNMNGGGLVPVVILNTPGFDPLAEVDVNSVRFGDPEDVIAGQGATPAHGGHADDVDDDGDDDLKLHFPLADTGFEEDENRGKILGMTRDGRTFFDTDGVTFVGEGQGNGGGNGSGGGSGNGPGQ